MSSAYQVTDGVAIGGWLELALGCHYRLVVPGSDRAAGSAHRHGAGCTRLMQSAQVG